MFTPDWRENTRAEIIETAKKDPRLKGGAITGSGSVGKLDAWSDIDLAFGVREAEKLPEVLAAYTEILYRDYGAVQHLDVQSGAWIYRVFLLSNTLQIDLAFAPQEQFGARAPTFKLVFGGTGGATHAAPAQQEVYIGWCWLCALHIRSSLKRGKVWQAEHFLSGMRNYLISLLCRRYKLPEKEGRGVDQLPPEELRKLEATLADSLDPSELRRAFTALTGFYLEEVGRIDGNLRQSIEPVLKQL